MSCPPNARKAFNNKSKNSSSNSSSYAGSKLGSICGKRTEQILSSTVNSSQGSTTTECDISDIEKPIIKNQCHCPKEQDKEAKKAVSKSKALTSLEKAEISYGIHIQKLYFCSLQAERIKSEAEICFSDFEAEKIKLDTEIATFKEWLKKALSLQESETRIEELKNIFMEVEGDMYQLQAMLKKVNLNMKIACRQVPLTMLKVTDASRDEFLSSIQELSNIRNEIISIMKQHEDSQTCAAQNLDTCVSTAKQLHSLIKECCSILPSVVASYLKTLSLQICLKHKDEDFKLLTVGPISGNSQ